MEARPFERGLGLPGQGSRELEVLLAEGAPPRPLPHRQEAAQPLAGGEGNGQREARPQKRLPELAGRHVGDAPRNRQLALESAGLARDAAGRLPRPDAAGVGQVEPFRAQTVQGAPRGEEVAHHRRGHQALDRVLVQARRQLAADVEQAVELVDLHGERAVDAAQLLVDEAVLDRRRRAGGEALEEARLLGPERPPLGPRPEPEEGDQRGPPCGPGTRGRSPPARRLPGPARTGPPSPPPAPRTSAVARREPAPGTAAEAPPRPPPRRARRAPPAARPSRSGGRRRGSPPRVSVEPRVVLRSRSEISSDIRLRRGGSRPSRRNSSSACWYW